MRFVSNFNPTPSKRLDRTRRAGLAATAAAVLLAAAIPAAAIPPRIASKQAQAEQVLGEINALDSRVNRAVEAWNLANIQLDELRAELRTNRVHLGIARHTLARSQRIVSQRLVALYTADSGDSAMEVVLGAKSLVDLVDRLDTADRVAEQDARVITSVTASRDEIIERRSRLRVAQKQQAQVVAERAAERQAIQGQLAERQQLLGSIKSEIVRLQAEEAARQERLRREAEARIQAQQRAAEAARARAAAQKEAAAATTAPATTVESQRALPEATASVVEQPAPPPTEAVAPLAAPSPAPTTEAAAPLAPPSPAPSQYGGVVGVAMRYLGVPYVWGGSTPSGFDCSGFTMYVYAQVGVSLPHYTGSQFQMGAPVSRDQLQPGDLVFFDGLGHEGIYIGGGQFIHAPHSGDVVKISSMDEAWYASRFDGARRLG